MGLIPSPGLIARRDFLRIGAAGISVAAGSSLATRSLAAACAPGGPFNLYAWAGYEGPGIPEWDKFWSDNGIELNLRAIGNEEFLQLLRAPGGDQWDAFVLNQGENLRYAGEGVFTPITVEEVPNLANMYEAFTKSPFWANEDGTFKCVPFTVAPLGINYNADRTPEGFKSYADALNPDVRVSCFDDALNMISTAACATGLDPSVLTREELNGPVKDWLMKLRPQLKLISPSLGDQLTVLINGEVDLQLVGLTWNVAQGKSQGVNIAFVYPSEGTYGSVDSIGIPATAPSRCNALAYCNAGLDPDLGAKVNQTMYALGATPQINANLSAEVLALYPENLVTGFFDVMKWNVSHVDPEGPYAPIDAWKEVWTEVKLAG
jgi:spermidine/putrescine-binding protein